MEQIASHIESIINNELLPAKEGAANNNWATCYENVCKAIDSLERVRHGLCSPGA